MATEIIDYPMTAGHPRGGERVTPFSPGGTGSDLLGRERFSSSLLGIPLAFALLAAACASNPPPTSRSTSSPTEAPRPTATAELQKPSPTIEIQQLPTDGNWTKTWLDKYPWNPKTQEGALDAHLGISMWGKFQSLDKDKMLVMVNGSLVLVKVTDTVPYNARPKNLDPTKPIDKQVAQITPEELKPGNAIEIMHKNGADGKPAVTSVSRLDG